MTSSSSPAPKSAAIGALRFNPQTRVCVGSRCFSPTEVVSTGSWQALLLSHAGAAPPTCPNPMGRNCKSLRSPPVLCWNASQRRLKRSPPSPCFVPSVRNRGIIPSCSGSGGQEAFALHGFFSEHGGGAMRGGTFLEVGANDGIDSNTLHLETCLGWKGVVIEGHPATFQRLSRNRPRALAISSAICRVHGTVEFTSASSPTARIPLHMEKGLRTRTMRRKNGTMPTMPVPCGPLGDWLDLIRMTHIDFVSLDVEGAQRMVLSTVDWSRLSVRVLVVECKGRGCLHADDYAVSSFLAERGLKRVATLRVRHDVWDVVHANSTWLSSRWSRRTLGLPAGRCVRRNGFCTIRDSDYRAVTPQSPHRAGRTGLKTVALDF